MKFGIAHHGCRGAFCHAAVDRWAELSFAGWQLGHDGLLVGWSFQSNVPWMNQPRSSRRRKIQK